MYSFKTERWSSQFQKFSRLRVNMEIPLTNNGKFRIQIINAINFNKLRNVIINEICKRK